MSLSVVLAVIVLGVILILLEILVIPGITVAGIAGTIFAFGGVVAAFYYHGTMVGLCSLAVSIIVVAISWWILLNSGSSSWMSLSKTLEGRSSESMKEQFTVGDVGTTVTRLNPIGKADINGKLVEVTSFSGFVDEGEEVRVIEVKANSLIISNIKE
ncbi:MAG: membrane-bound ClpP family serine protease [Granulosicoccus sp.]|jgi:membrane-bound ClpP family serine protease